MPRADLSADWTVEAHGGRVRIAPPSTVADVVVEAVTKRREDGSIELRAGRTVVVPADRPTFVLTVEAARELRDRLSLAIGRAVLCELEPGHAGQCEARRV
jgi:hypothetical protein